MKTFVTKILALWLVIGMTAAHAQAPAPPPAEGPGARPTNLAVPTNSPFFSRSTNFGRALRTDLTNPAARLTNPVTRLTNAAGVTNTAAARTIATPLPAPVFPAATPGVPGGAVPGPGVTRPNPLLPSGPVGPSITSTSANFAATNIVPRGSTNDIQAKMMNFQEADLSQILEVYAELTGKTIIKSPQVPQNVKISLRNQTPLTRQEGIDALNTVLGLNQIGMVPEGEKFIKAVPQASIAQEATPFSTNDYAEIRETQTPVAQIVTLKHMAPDEAVQFIQPFAKLPNSIVGLKGSPILVLRDYAENVKRMLEILDKVDVELPLDIETVVIPIKYALAGEIAGVLSGLGASTGSGLSGGGGGAGGFSGGGAGSSGFGGAGGINRSGIGGTGFGGTGFGGTGVGGYQGGTTLGTGARGFGTTAGLGTSGAGSFGSRGGTFGNRLGSAVQRAVGTQGGGQGTGEFVVIGQYGPTKIIPDERSNALLVFADRRDLAQISNIIAKLDVVLPQVIIDALIMEVNLSNGKNLGVSMQQNNQKLGDLNVAGGSVNGGFLDPRSVSGVTSLATNTSLPSGFSYFGKLNQDFDFAVTASANDSRINVLSRPHVTTSTAKPASIFVGETRPYITGSYFSDFAGSGSRSQYAQTQIGISLNVLPIINQEGLVVMDIQQHISQVGATTKIDNNDVPTTIDRDANAYVAVHDRDTILLGGFISTTKNKSNSGVPFLKDIPGLGMLFRSQNENVSRVELMVLIRPTVLPTPEAAALETANRRDKLPGIKRAERDEQEFSRKQLDKDRKEEEKFEKREGK